MGIEVRPAREEDQDAIVALVRGERLNPTGLDWRRFHVACEDGALVGTVQVRPEGPELASLAVRGDRRGRGLSGRLIEAALADAAGPVFVVCQAGLCALYERHGFARWPVRRTPRAVAVHLALGQAFGTLAALLLERRRPRRLVVLRRPDR